MLYPSYNHLNQCIKDIVQTLSSNYEIVPVLTLLLSFYGKCIKIVNCGNVEWFSSTQSVQRPTSAREFNSCKHYILTLKGHNMV